MRHGKIRPAWILAVVPAVVAIAGMLAGEGRAAGGERQTPYWASISAGQARMRTGPGRQFPVSWLYQRADLPVRVVEVVPSWRRIQDPDGASGWVMVNLLSDQRTAIVTGGVSAMRAAPAPGARITWRAEAGVVGRISHCADGWCRFNVHGREGFIETAHLWGVGADETVD